MKKINFIMMLHWIFALTLCDAGLAARADALETKEWKAPSGQPTQSAASGPSWTTTRTTPFFPHDLKVEGRDGKIHFHSVHTKVGCNDYDNCLKASLVWIPHGGGPTEIGYFEVDIPFEEIDLDSPAFVTDVFIEPEYRDQHLFTPFVEYALKAAIKLFPRTLDEVHFMMASDPSTAAACCHGYLRGFLNAGFHLVDIRPDFPGDASEGMLFKGLFDHFPKVPHNPYMLDWSVNPTQGAFCNWLGDVAKHATPDDIRFRMSFEYGPPEWPHGESTFPSEYQSSEIPKSGSR